MVSVIPNSISISKCAPLLTPPPQVIKVAERTDHQVTYKSQLLVLLYYTTYKFQSYWIVSVETPLVNTNVSHMSHTTQNITIKFI